MSMNLYARCGKTDLNLWQTTTQHTFMICSTPTGLKQELTGKEARRALHAYRQMVINSMNCECGSREVREDCQRIANDHIAYIDQFIDKPRLTVWFM